MEGRKKRGIKKMRKEEKVDNRKGDGRKEGKVNDKIKKQRCIAKMTYERS